LLIDLAHHIELPVSWLSIDHLDNDFQRFTAHFIASISRCFPKFGQQSSALLQGAPQVEEILDQLVTTIVNEAYEHIHEHYILILDDFHLVADNEAISLFVSRFTQGVDENCHLVIASRTLLPIPDLPLMVARSQVGGLSYDELVFQPEEIQALAAQNYSLSISSEDAEEMVRVTEGWITGLLLSTQTMWQGMTDRLRVARASGVDLYSYLVQQVLDHQPTSIQDFLLQTSLLEEFNAAFCQSVLGDPQIGESWANLINTVIQNNLFILPVGEDETWLRYHHLFGDFLRTQMERNHPQLTQEILYRLADVYVERKEWVKAHAIYHRLEDNAALANLIEQAGTQMIKRGQILTLSNWVDELPTIMMYKRPRLLALRGNAATILGQVEWGQSLLSQSVHILKEQDDQLRLAGILPWRSTARRFLGDYHGALNDAEEALNLVAGKDEPQLIKAEALKTKGLCLFRLGRHKEAILPLKQSLAIYRIRDQEEDAAMVNMDLGMTYRGVGEYSRAEVTYHTALKHWRKVQNLSLQANLLNNMGVLYHAKGVYPQAAKYLEEALVCARRSGYVRIEGLTLASIGDIYADLEATEAALEAYRMSREIAQRLDDRFLRIYLDLAEAAIYRMKGDFRQARDLLASVKHSAIQGGSDNELGRWELEAGLIALAEDDPPAAISHLEKATKHYQDSGQRPEAARAHLYLGLAYLAIQDNNCALFQLKSAIDLAWNPTQIQDQDRGTQHALIVAAREAKALLTLANSDPSIGHHVAQLEQSVDAFEGSIQHIRRQLRKHPPTVAFVPPRLTIRALGNTSVRLDGKPVIDSWWVQQRTVRDFFFYLLSHLKRFRKEDIASIFWPDSSPSKVKRQFKNTIYRLRRSLGQDVILFDDEMYWFNQDLDYEFDVEKIKGKITQAKQATSTEAQISAYSQVVDMYTGNFLPEMDSNWALTIRESLLLEYINALKNLGKLTLEKNDYELSLSYSRRMLNEDPLLEEGHRLAMRAHAGMGNQAGIVRQYEECCQTLMSVLGISPSPQTLNLYQELME
jgi:ATP/maltotriose-dependent transcriptional regulator MalT/DNA-binding SARP family transcriptional activator